LTTKRQAEYSGGLVLVFIITVTCAPGNNADEAAPPAPEGLAGTDVLKKMTNGVISGHVSICCCDYEHEYLVNY
jgi:hypothetical protein